MYHLSLKQNISPIKSRNLLDKVLLRSNMPDLEPFPATALSLHAVAGQWPKTNYAKRPLAGFKIRKDQPLSLQLTLRSNRMHYFLRHLIFAVLPKFVDFDGVNKKKVDSQGNLHFGLTQFFFWPQCEAFYEIFRKPTGFHVSLVSKGSPKRKPMIYSYLGLPLTDKEANPL